jgi:hypothetical protein
MHTLKRAVVVATVIAAAVAGCGSEKDEHSAAANSKEVCGHFAKDSDTATALSRISGTDRFSEGGSKRKQTLASLRAADGKTDSAQELQGSPLCVLKSADGETSILSIYFREASTVSKASSENEKTFTFYGTGASAMASNRLASIYFRCRMQNPSKSLIINGSLERENKLDIDGKEAADQQMVVMNAAARQVAKDLGCDGAGLSKQPPQAVSGVYAGK